MANPSSKRTVTPTAAAERESRVTVTPTSASKPVAKVEKAKSEKSKTTKKATTSAGASDGVKKKRKAASVQTKFRKERLARKAKTGKSTSMIGFPDPVQVYNDHFKNTGDEYEVERLVESKVNKGQRSYLVKWVGYGSIYNSWEPETNLRNATHLIAEFDKAVLDKP